MNRKNANAELVTDNYEEESDYLCLLQQYLYKS